MPKASFILPTMNVEKHIRPLLEAIFSQESDYEIEVLMMDSSTDRTIEVAREFPVKSVWVEPQDYNYGKTRNEGAAMTSGDLLVFLSADVGIRDSHWLSKLTRPFADPKVAGVYGRQLPKEGAAPMEQYFILSTYPPDSALYSLKEGKLKRGIVLFSNTNSAIRRSIWEEIKIPEMLKGEEQEWAKKALLAGYKIAYESQAVVYHSHKYSLKGAMQEYFDSGATIPVIYQGGIINYSMSGFLADGLKHVAREYKFMLKNGYAYWIPYAIIYDMAKCFGMFLGSKQKLMPLWMKRALCRKKNHWDRYDDVIQEAR